MRLRALLLALVLLLGVAACGGDDDEEAGGEPTVTETDGTTTDDDDGTTTDDDDGTTTDDDDETTTDDDDDGDNGEGDPEAGAQVFAQAGCGGCHVLEAANSSGSVGPNLDEAEPEFDTVVERVTEGSGVMPSFKDQLSEQQIRDVAAYVSESVDD